MPGFLSGLLPLAVAFLIGDGALMIAGLFFTLVAGGDFLILWLAPNASIWAGSVTYVGTPGS